MPLPQDQDAAIEASGGHAFRDGLGEVEKDEVHRIGRGRAEVVVLDAERVEETST